MKRAIRKLTFYIGVALLPFSGAVHADTMDLPFFDGEIIFSGFSVDYHGFIAGDAHPTGGTGLEDATGIDFSDEIPVLFALGDFAGVVPGTLAAFNDVLFNPSSPVSPIWVIDLIIEGAPVQYSFFAEEFRVNHQDGLFLSVASEGYISATGYQNTEANWTFTMTQAGEYGRGWASTTAVPEPGTLALFSLGLFGCAVAVRRRRVKV